MRYQLPLVFVDAVARSGSIRKAADTLAISSTALNRRILSLEEDVGAPLFERLPGGVRLSSAGELFVHFARRELAEAEQLRARVAELSGGHRGHVAFACGQALMQAKLPDLVADSRKTHTKTTMEVRVCKRSEIAALLEGFEIDLALALEPELTSTTKIIASTEQRVQLICRPDHPLLEGQLPAAPVRLDDCFDFPMVLPTRGHGVRHLLEEQASRLGRPLPVVLESDSSLLLTRVLVRDWSISFEVPAGAAPLSARIAEPLVHREIDARDIRAARLCLLQLRGRTLSVAAARFAERLTEIITADRLPHAPDSAH